jgi:hypothetical protein
MFRTRQAHARSRGPRVWVAPRRVARRVRHGQLSGGFDRHALEGQLNPFAPGKTVRPDRRISDFGPRPRGLLARPFLERSVVDNLVRSWPPDRRNQ